MSPGSSRVAGAGPDAIPASLLAFAELHLRRAYDHAAREHRAAVASRAPGPSASADDDPADAAVDADAANPPDPAPGIAATLRDLAALARAHVADPDADAPKRRRLDDDDRRSAGGDARARDADDPETTARASAAHLCSAGAEKQNRPKKLVPAARFHADAKSLALAARADWRVARAVLLTRELTARDAAERSVAFARRAAWRRAVITVHHQTLRDDVKRVTKKMEQRSGSNPPGDASPGGAETRRGGPNDADPSGTPEETGTNAAEDRSNHRSEAIEDARTRAWRAAVDATLLDDDDGGDGGGAEDGTRADADAATPPRDKRDTRPNDARFKKKKALLDYAEAAEEVGNRAWVLSALEWCRAKISDFVFGGAAARFAMKAERRAHHARFGRRMTPAEAEAVRARLAEGPLGLFERRKSGDDGSIGGGDPEPTPSQGSRVKGQGSRRFRKPRLLDVGSCWDYFRRFRDDFDVVALDLCPRAPEVFRCDFSRLKVAPPTSDGGEEEEKEEENEAAAAAASSPGSASGPSGIPSNAGGERSLESLPEGSFHACVFSLVLSYVPCPRMRGEMIVKARRLLAPAGRGLLLIVTPHSTDRGHAPHRALPILEEWRVAIEGCGFERVARERGKGAHYLAFRTVGEGAGAGGEGGAPEGVRAPEIRIAFDDTPRAELGGADRARAEEEEALRREAEEAKQTREATTTGGAK